MSARTRVVLAALMVVFLAACGAAQPTPSVGPSVAPSVAQSEPPTPSADTESPDPSATHTASPSPIVVGFQAATVPPTENASSIIEIVPGGDGLVAIGFDGAFGSILWTSGDGGRTWTDITPDAFASIGIASVAEHDGRLVGVGRGNTLDVDAQEAAVYLSEDGVEWREVDTGQALIGQMIDVITTDDGLFAVGGVPGADSAGVWHSLDGEVWARVGDDFEHAFLWSIAEGGPGLVAVGWRRDPEPVVAVWTSADEGRTWELASDPDGHIGFEATDIAATDDGFTMVGSAFDGSGGRIWTSSDGVTWTVAVDEMDGAFARSLTPTSAGLVAAGGDDQMHGRVWLSTDGASWEPLGNPVDGAFLQFALETPDGYLFAGATQAGTLETGVDARAMIWIAAIGD